MVFIFSVFVFFSFASWTGAALDGNIKGSPQDLTDIICNGRPRDSCAVELDVPQVCATSSATSSSLFNDDDPACPIVFFLHGSGGTNINFKNNSGVHGAGYIGVYPQGDGGWNTGPKNSNACDWDEFDCDQDPDEGDFIKAIIDKIRSLGGTGNIYVKGNSNGAALAHRLAANAGTDLPIKGIFVAVTQLLASPERSGPGVLNYNQPSSTRGGGTPSVSVLSVMGTEDGLIPYEGGSSSVFGGVEAFQLMPTLTSMTTWAIHNGCDGESIVTRLPTDRGDGTADFYDYSGSCPPGIIVEHYAINGGQHNAGGAKIDGEKIDPLDFVARVEAGLSGPRSPTLSPSPSPVPLPTVSMSPTSTPPCDDDETWHGKFSSEHTCQYVSKNPTVRCQWENSEGVKAEVACPKACDSCPSTESPVASPTTIPSTVPSPIPTSLSEDKCEVGDDPSGLFYFKTKNDGQIVTKKCSWLEDKFVSSPKKAANACKTKSEDGVAYEPAEVVCPNACGKCPCPNDEPTASLYWKEKVKTCAFLMNRVSRGKSIRNHCKSKEGIEGAPPPRVACPGTCEWNCKAV